MTAVLLLLAPVAGAAFAVGGFIAATGIWQLATFELDSTQEGYAATFALLGAVPFVLSLLWVTMAAITQKSGTVLSMRSLAASRSIKVATLLFLAGGALSAWMLGIP